VRIGVAGAGWTVVLGAAGVLLDVLLLGVLGGVVLPGKSCVDEPPVDGGPLVLPEPPVVLLHAASAAASATTVASDPAIARSFTADSMSRTGCSCRIRDTGRVPGRDSIDELDARLLRELDESPRVGVLELSRRLGVARGTVQARLDRLVRRGVIASFAPTLDPVALGYAVTAFATLEIRQGRGHAVLAHLQDIPEVLEVHTITGAGDMLCRVVARSNDDLQRVLDRVTEFPEIVRTSTVIALSNPVRHRVLPLV
jgi:Transcriptional regulators